MHRRYLFPLASGAVVLLAISPVFAAEPSPAKAGSGPGKATTTTAGRNAPTTSNTSATAPPEQQSPPPEQQSPPPEQQSPPPQAGPSPSPPPPGAGGGKSTSECGQPQTNQGPAPQAGQPPQSHPAGDAGTVDIERGGPSELRVAKANPNNGWQPEVTSASGPRITVKFTHPGYSPSLVHFAATMDQAGRMIHTRVQSCG